MIKSSHDNPLPAPEDIANARAVLRAHPLFARAVKRKYRKFGIFLWSTSFMLAPYRRLYEELRDTIDPTRSMSGAMFSRVLAHVLGETGYESTLVEF